MNDSQYDDAMWRGNELLATTPDEAQALGDRAVELADESYTQTQLQIAMACVFAAAVHADDVDFMDEMLDENPVGLSVGLAHVVLMLIGAIGDDPPTALSSIIDGVAPGLGDDPTATEGTE